MVQDRIGHYRFANEPGPGHRGLMGLPDTMQSYYHEQVIFELIICTSVVPYV